MGVEQQALFIEGSVVDGPLFGALLTTEMVDEVASILKLADPDSLKLISAILRREGVTAGCFSYVCSGKVHAHAPTS